jgi:uncharacterized protein with ATP-grasp and redox domains
MKLNKAQKTVMKIAKENAPYMNKKDLCLHVHNQVAKSFTHASKLPPEYKNALHDLVNVLC